jgi:signal transduction histidine kinase
MADQGGAQLWVVRLVTRHPQAVDVVVGLAVAAWYLIQLGAGHAHGPHPARALTGVDVLAAAIACGLVAVRRRWPRAVLGLAVAATVVSMAAGEARAAFIPVAVIAAFTVATDYGRATAWACGAAAVAVLYGASFAWPDKVWPDAQWWETGDAGVPALVGMGVAVGDAIRTRRQYLVAVEERARRAEQSREEEAHRRVMDERLRIARELHDVVAHNLALISVQSGVAAHLMQSSPDKATAALNHVRDAANTAVGELGTVLAVLRQDSDPDGTTEPAPGLANLPALLDAVTAAGLRVRHRQDGRVRRLPAAMDLAAYRIIQEALTNAGKHGVGGTAELALTHADDGLTIEVTNPMDSRAPGGNGTGHGVIGMRERAAAAGGTLHADPEPAGVFVVRAFLPAAARPEGVR